MARRWDERGIDPADRLRILAMPTSVGKRGPSMTFQPPSPGPSWPDPTGSPPRRPNELSGSVEPNALSRPPSGSDSPHAPAGDQQWPSAAPRRQTRRGPLVGGLAILAGVIGTVGWKLLVGTVAVGIVGGTVSAFFGGPWDKLPSDVRASYQHRLETAVGSRLDGVSESAAKAQFETWLHGGFARLDDARLVRHLQLEVDALNRTSEKDCASFGRESMGGKPVDDDTSQHLVASLDQAAMVEFVGLNVDAIEAELRGSPAAVSVSSAESAPILQQMLGRLSSSQMQTLTALNSGTTITDREMCDAVRGLYGQSLSLDPSSLALLARLDVSP
jgi:hypothetical protein